MDKDKIVFKGSHPDSLYRVQADIRPGDRMVRMLRVLRWPVALIAVCIALAVFVYFLMPDNMDSVDNASNQTIWEPVTAGAHNYKTQGPAHRQHLLDNTAPKRGNDGTKTPEIDFYDSENNKHGELTSDIDAITDTNPQRVLSVKPVFPSHIMLEVQYGNERTDADKLRTPKLLDTTLSGDSTLKPHITQKPEKPLAVYFKDLNEATTTTVETISRAETMNDFTNHENKQTTKKVELSTKSRPTTYKDRSGPLVKPLNVKQYLVTEPENLDEEQEFFGPMPSGNIETNFTSGHSMLFGISIEDAEKMKSTTQSSTYNTRVSPTLPTWRDGDDSTTKHYPVNFNTEAPICRSTRYTLCRGVLPYDLAGFPVKFRGVDFSAFMPHIEYLVHTNCSNRARQFACALLEPECNPYPHQSKMPCYSLCRAIVDSCDGSIAKQLMPAFDCKQYGHTDCIAARSPCYDRELACSDGTCIPREWVCDNQNDCPGGEDEAQCSMCAKNEYRCSSGGCILNRWLCDGYADCPGGEDEVEACDRQVAGELGEESAGSAPAPAVRRPNRVPLKARSSSGDLLKTGENDNSKELLVTSDSNNGFKRNFTRRPSLSRLSPYTRSTQAPAARDSPVMRDYKPFPIEETEAETRQDAETTQKSPNADSIEDINIGDLGFFDEIKKTGKNVKDESEEASPKRSESKPSSRPKPSSARAAQIPSEPAPRTSARLDKSINKLEKVINGAALMQKTQAMDDQEAAVDSPETNITNIDKDDFPIAQRPGSISAHVSPCPSGELRCVDGRCITLAQLCDGTIDCTDHADEDNCFT